MTESTYAKLCSLGFLGNIDTPSQEVIHWLNLNEILRVEPYWRFLGADGGYSWSKSQMEFSDRVEVSCDTFEELLDIALDNSVKEAL